MRKRKIVANERCDALVSPVDAFPGEDLDSYGERAERMISSWQCDEREGGGYRCELRAGHDGPCVCSEAMKNWLKTKYSRSSTYGSRVAGMEAVHHDVARRI